MAAVRSGPGGRQVVVEMREQRAGNVHPCVLLRPKAGVAEIVPAIERAPVGIAEPARKLAGGDECAEQHGLLCWSPDSMPRGRRMRPRQRDAVGPDGAGRAEESASERDCPAKATTRATTMSTDPRVRAFMAFIPDRAGPMGFVGRTALPASRTYVHHRSRSRCLTERGQSCRPFVPNRPCAAGSD